MTKITHLGKYYPPDKGGIESVTRILAEAAIEDGYEVKVISFSKTSSEVTRQSSVKVSRHRACFEFKSQPLSWGYFWDAILESFKSEIVHLHAPNLLATIAVLIIPKK